MSQVTNGDEDGSCRIWSHWHNIPESDSYSLVMMSAQDCMGTETQTTEATAMAGQAPNSMNLTGEFDDGLVLADLADTCSIGVKDADGEMFACCNIELKKRAEDERGEGDAPQSAVFGDSTGGQSKKDENAAKFEARHGRARGRNNENGEGEGFEGGEGDECVGEECGFEGGEEAEGTSDDSVASEDSMSEGSMSEDSMTADEGYEGDEGVIPGLLGDERAPDVEDVSEETMDEDTQSEDTADDLEEASAASEESICDPLISTCEEDNADDV